MVVQSLSGPAATFVIPPSLELHSPSTAKQCRRKSPRSGGRRALVGGSASHGALDGRAIADGAAGEWTVGEGAVGDGAAVDDAIVDGAIVDGARAIAPPPPWL